jgi:hypothetical protein
MACTGAPVICNFFYQELTRPERGLNHRPASSAEDEVKEIVELYPNSSSGPSWPVAERTLPL